MGAHFLSTVQIGLLLSACWLAACDRQAPRAAQLDSLIRHGASRDEVVRQLGTGYVLYEKTDVEMWRTLEQYWGGERRGSLHQLREKAERYPKVMHYTTAWTTTWVFLDEHDKARDYYQGTQ
jgi:hypothetical protein